MFKIKYLGAAAVPVLAVLALALPASASVGGPLHSAGQTGYAVTGGQFRYVQGSLYLRSPGQYASYLCGAGGSVSLWASSGTVVQLGISDTTGGTASCSSTAGSLYSPGVAVFAADHSQDPGSMGHASWCPAGGSCAPASQGGGFKVGDTVTLSAFYNRAAGIVSLNETDAAGNVFHAWFPVGRGLSFTKAEVSSDFGITPWDAKGLTGTKPASALKLARWSHASLTNYAGHRGSLSGGPWKSHRLAATSDGTAKGTPFAASSGLSGGSAFTTSLLP